MKNNVFQYRKRYGLHAIKTHPQVCPNGQTFQYRKRYGLHAIATPSPIIFCENVSIPQAVWIACNKSAFEGVFRPLAVSIPQAVWIACNYRIISPIVYF